MSHVCSYWLSCLFFTVISTNTDATTAFIYPIAFKARQQHQPSYWKILNAICVSIINQAIALPLAWWIAPYCINDDYDDLRVVPLKFLFYATLADQWFYWIHRTIHHRWIYQYIHSIHHQWTYPIPVSTLYAHPVEHVLGNILSLLIGPLLWPTNSWVMHIWIVLATFNAVSGHSGMHFPWFSIEKHDLHHRLLNCNFGTSGISDRMYGTRRFDKMHGTEDEMQHT